VTVPPAAGHNSRKASASIRRDKRLKTRTSQDAQGASVAAATERLTAVSQRNSNAVHLDATRREITMTDDDHDAMEADNFWAEVDALATAHGA
jgi:hypothetical protein